jgi:hypothetical protein
LPVTARASIASARLLAVATGGTVAYACIASLGLILARISLPRLH